MNSSHEKKFIQCEEISTKSVSTQTETKYFEKVLMRRLPDVTSDEISFSSLKRLRTYLRNRRAHERSSGLALLNIDRYIDVNIDEVIVTADSRR
jgi:hypothetical protein